MPYNSPGSSVQFSGFSVFVELHNQQHNQFKNIFSSPLKDPPILSVITLPQPPSFPDLGNYSSLFCLYQCFACYGHFIETESHNGLQRCSPPEIQVLCICSPWVWAGFSNSLLSSWIWQKWWVSLSRMGYKRAVVSIRNLLLTPLNHFHWNKEAALREQPCGETLGSWRLRQPNPIHAWPLTQEAALSSPSSAPVLSGDGIHPTTWETSTHTAPNRDSSWASLWAAPRLEENQVPLSWLQGYSVSLLAAEGKAEAGCVEHRYCQGKAGS